jgi:pimeloyl-ACP methyl ester carboxylesterase
MSPNPESRFQSVALIHDAGDSPEGYAGEFRRILGESHPGVRFILPYLPMETRPAEHMFDQVSHKLFPLLPPHTLLVGFGLGGLVACVMQERFPHLSLPVFAINAPACEDGLEIEAGLYQRPERTVIYSDRYKPIEMKCEYWDTRSSYAVSVPWLANGVQKAMYATAYVLSSFMRGLDLTHEIVTLFPDNDHEIRFRAATEVASIQ